MPRLDTELTAGLKMPFVWEPCLVQETSAKLFDNMTKKTVTLLLLKWRL
jgi:hypothetical protein